MADYDSQLKPLDYFASLVQEEKAIPLFEAALSIAQDEDPTIDLNQAQSIAITHVEQSQEPSGTASTGGTQHFWW